MTNLRLLVLLALATLSPVLRAQSTLSAAGQRLEGSWTFVVTITGLPNNVPTTFKSLVTFMPDGGFVETAWSSTPFSFLSVGPWFGHGEWLRTGNREFALTVIYPRFDGMGNFVGLGKGLGKMTLGDTLDQASGQFQVSLTDAQGNGQFTATGALQATRLQIESLD